MEPPFGKTIHKAAAAISKMAKSEEKSLNFGCIGLKLGNNMKYRNWGDYFLISQFPYFCNVDIIANLWILAISTDSLIAQIPQFVLLIKDSNLCNLCYL